MAPDPSSPVVSQERIQDLRQRAERDDWGGPAKDERSSLSVGDVCDLLLALDAAIALANAHRQDSELLDASGVDAETSVRDALKAALSARDVALARAAAAEEKMHDAWWAGRQSISSLPLSWATGEKLKARCASDIKAILQPLPSQPGASQE